MATQKQIQDSIIQQLRILDPSISAEVGTPERKIIETVAMAIAESQVDLNVLNGAFDIDSKTSSDLDNMLAILGFGRQSGVKSTGFVTFSRDSAATSTIIIKMGTTIFSPTGGDGGQSVVFRTTTTVSIPVGSQSVVAPIEAIQVGTVGNVAANTITESVGEPIYGITSIANEYPTTGGLDQESDVEMKARFTKAGPFRNLSGTYDQYLALALSTLSTKANVVGPISKYREYLQVPTTPDVAGGVAYTTNLSNNQNSKHIYTNVPYFVINDSGISQIYYSEGSDFILNTDPSDKNKGDANRNSDIVDPTSTEAPILYQPNVTFTNVYTGSKENAPTNAILPEDVLLFEHSYMSTASRNDYDRNVLNCVDVFVNNSDVKVASATIARPGIDVPTYYFVADETSAFYVNNYRRVDEPEHRPVKGNVYTPLYKQPAVDLPSQITLTNGTFIKGIHYWLVEEITDLYGTVRARNGIEWSSTIPSKGSSDADNGPYTGPKIIDTSISSTNLAQNIPSSDVESTTFASKTFSISTKNLLTSNVAELALSSLSTGELNVGDYVSVTGCGIFNGSDLKITAVDTDNDKIKFDSPTSSPSYGITNKASTGGTATLTTNATHDIAVGDTIVVSGVGSPFNGTFTTTSGTTGTTIKYALSGTVSSTACSGKATIDHYASARSVTSATMTLTKIKSANKTNIKVNSTSGFPDSGYILIGSEIISYSSKTGGSDTVFEITGRGLFGTKTIDLDVTSSSTKVNLLIELTSSVGLPNNDYIRIGDEQIAYSIPISTSTSLIQVTERASNGTAQAIHYANDLVYVLFTTIDQSVQIQDYQYDQNIINLQASLEANKQVTTDVLAHKAKVRYFKPDVTVMYSTGSNRSAVNESIRIALKEYFNSLYFGNEIQMSDILQTIHNVGGVDNVRWSRDGLTENGIPVEYDSTGNARPKIVETDKSGNPIGSPILDQIKVGNNVYSSEYRLYLPYAPSGADTTKLSVPTNIVTSTETISGPTNSIGDSLTYRYVITALTDDNGETTASSVKTITTTASGTYHANYLSWDPVDGATGYKVYRNTSGSTFTSGSLLIAKLGEDETDFYDLGTVENPQMGGVPPSINTALLNPFTPGLLSYFKIQYGQKQPVTIQYDDFILELYDADKSYSENDVVYCGANYYRSMVPENLGNDPTTDTNSIFWKLDSSNKIGFDAKINADGEVISISSQNGFITGPSFDNYVTITYTSAASTQTLKITESVVNSGFGVFDNDFQLKDNEVASLPIGVTNAGSLDLSSVITIRAKAQNTWGT